MAAKTPVSDWRIAALCTRWLGLASSFTGGSLTLAQELKRIIRKDSSAALYLGLPGHDLERIVDYMDLVWAEAEKRNAHRDPRLLSHVHIGTTSLERAAAFYDAALAPLECRKLYHHPNEIAYGKRGPELWIGLIADTEGVVPGNSSYFGMWATTPEEVDAFHAAVLDAGGTSDGSPSFKDGNHIYSCDVRDLDGNRIAVLKWFDNPPSIP